MRPLAFSTNAFKKTTVEDAVDQIAAVGYAGVELMADVPHAYPKTYDGAARRALRERLKRLNVTVSNINAFTLFACGDTYHPTWIEDDPAKRDTRVQHTLGAIELAREFGAATVSLQPGGPLIGTGLSRAAASERFAEALWRVVPRAKKLGVILAIEPEPGLLIQTAGEFMEFKKDFFPREDAVRMNCDAGHLFCVGDDPAWVIRTLSEHVAHVHLEDIGENRVHQHLTPGKGAMDFPAIFAALDDVKYEGRVTVELYPYETTAAGVAKAAFEYLRQVGGK